LDDVLELVLPIIVGSFFLNYNVEDPSLLLAGILINSRYLSSRLKLRLMTESLSESGSGLLFWWLELLLSLFSFAEDSFLSFILAGGEWSDTPSSGLS
jgi:hypothetical protein